MIFGITTEQWLLILAGLAAVLSPVGLFAKSVMDRRASDTQAAVTLATAREKIASDFRVQLDKEQSDFRASVIQQLNSEQQRGDIATKRADDLQRQIDEVRAECEGEKRRLRVENGGLRRVVDKLQRGETVNPGDIPTENGLIKAARAVGGRTP